MIAQKGYTFLTNYNDPLNYYWFDNVFSKEEIELLQTEIDKIDFQTAGISGGHTNDKIRSSNIKWLPQNEVFDWVYQKIFEMVLEANLELWRFDINSATEQIQYTTYDSNQKGHYSAHQDLGPGDTSIRKISVVIQLSDPSEYEGGELEFIFGDGEPMKIKREMGFAVIFPSYLMHRVTPVTKGLRKSLVLWLGGSHFR